MVAQPAEQTSTPDSEEPPSDATPGLSDADAPLVPSGETVGDLDRPIVELDAGTPDEPADGATPSDAEPPKEKPAAEVTPEVEPPTVKVEDTEEYKDLQRKLDIRASAAEARARTAEAAKTEAEALRTDEEKVEAFRREWRATLTQHGLDPTQYAAHIETSATSLKQGLADSRALVAAQAQIRDSAVQTAVTQLGAFVTERVTALHLSDADREVLQGLVDPARITSEDSFLAIGDQVDTLANRLGEATKAISERDTERKATVPAGDAAQNFDSHEGGATMTDEQTVTAYGDPNGDFNDHAAAARAMQRLGYNA